MDKSFRYVVVGCGGIGSAAAYQLAKESGGAVLGLDQYELGHTKGASSDHSRIIRMAQHQLPYARLAPHAYDAWHELEAEAGLQLLVKTGGLIIEATAERDAATTGTRNIAGYVAAFEELGFEYEVLESEAVMERWPQWRLSDTDRAIYSADTGMVDAKRATATHQALARAHGAELRGNTPVRALRRTPVGVEVVTDDDVFLAEHVVVATDAWTNELLAGVGVELPLTITEEQVTYYATQHLAAFSPERFPVFMWHGAHNFYGFPIHGEVATKLGQHMGGHEVTTATRMTGPDPVREARQREFLAEHLPEFGGPELFSKNCMYTIPPDQDFIVDTLPSAPEISVVIGAGHAFKFAALLGKVLAQLATKGRTDFPIDAFSLSRPAIADPSFPRTFHV
ncbi:N-methyl-L-tryptophan oxidase [soil metagenome]